MPLLISTQVYILPTKKTRTARPPAFLMGHFRSSRLFFCCLAAHDLSLCIYELSNFTMPIATYTTLWFLRRAAFLGTGCDQTHHDSHHDHNEDHQQRTTTQALVRCTHI